MTPWKSAWFINVGMAIVFPACSGGSVRNETSSGQFEEDQRAIEELHQADRRAVLASDTAGLMALWTDDIVSLPPTGPIRRGQADNAEALRNSMKQGSDFEAIDYQLQFQEIRILGDHAFEWGTHTSRVRPRKGGAEITSTGKVMRVLRKDSDGRWLVARTMFTVDP